MKTAVVILNWNTKDYLERFVPGVLRSLEGTDAELTVADSASEDGSMQMLAEKFPQVRQIRLDRNYGFTGGYNKALAEVNAEYFVLLNSDIEVPEGWLQPLVRTLDENPDVGACAPKLHSWYEKDRFEYAGAAGGYIDCFGFPFCRGRIMKRTEKDMGQYDTPADVMWATGACLMVRSSLFRSLGGLDGRFFAHMEEIDLCWRMQLEGYKVRIVPESTVWHLGGGTLPQTSPWKLKLNYRNNLLLLENNLAKTYALDLTRTALDRKLKGIKKETLAEKDARESYLNGIDLDRIAERACRKAGRRIFRRMLIDGCAGAAYLAMFRWDFFKAVVEAHSEFRKLSRRHNHSDGEVNAYLTRIADAAEIPEIRGIWPHWIITAAMFLGKKTSGKVEAYFSAENKRRHIW